MEQEKGFYMKASNLKESDGKTVFSKVEDSVYISERDALEFNLKKLLLIPLEQVGGGN